MESCTGSPSNDQILTGMVISGIETPKKKRGRREEKEKPILD
jgi:hypothetical protein